MSRRTADVAESDGHLLHMWLLTEKRPALMRERPKADITEGEIRCAPSHPPAGAIMLAHLHDAVRLRCRRQAGRSVHLHQPRLQVIVHDYIVAVTFEAVFVAYHHGLHRLYIIGRKFSERGEHKNGALSPSAQECHVCKRIQCHARIQAHQYAIARTNLFLRTSDVIFHPNYLQPPSAKYTNTYAQALPRVYGIGGGIDASA